MTSTSASAVHHVDDDFLLRQRRELSARRASYREQVERLTAAVEELAVASEAPDLGDEQGFAEADSLNVERDRVLSLTALARRRIDDVDAAIRRLESGTYGACRTWPSGHPCGPARSRAGGLPVRVVRERLGPSTEVVPQ